MLFGQTANVVAKTVGTLVLSEDVGVSMCVLRSFAVFVIITDTSAVAAAAAVAATVVTDMSFVDIFMIFGQTVHVVAETVIILRLQGRFVSVCSLLRSFAVRASIRNEQTTHYSILGVSGRVCVVE